MRQGQKKKQRNVKGRKNPKFADAVMLMFRDSHITLEEMMEKKGTRTEDAETGRATVRYDQLPDGCTVIDSLGGNAIFKEERLFRHIDRIALALMEFGSEFFTDEGSSVGNLRYDKKGRVWGNEAAIHALAYLGIAAGLAEWTQPRSEWKANEDQLPRIRFINPVGDEHEELSEITAPGEITNGSESNQESGTLN